MRTRAAAVGLAALAVTAGACSGGSPTAAPSSPLGSVSPPAASALPTLSPTPRPTRTRRPAPHSAVSPSPAATHRSTSKPNPRPRYATGRNSLAAIGAPGCVSLASNNVLATPVTGMPVDSHNAAWKGATNASGRDLHPDFGPSYGAQSVPYGLPWQVVSHGHRKVDVDFAYADESDRGPYPLGPDTPIEGGQSAGGDRHALVIDSGTCRLYETFDTHYSRSQATAGSGAIFALGSNALRPSGWTSADAAGLPIFPLLLRWDEVKAGHIDHAIRFTVSRSDRRFVWPARHQAGAASDSSLPPMGARARLRGSFSMAHYSRYARVVLQAMQKYGVIVADNGSDWYFQGDASTHWPDSLISELKTIPASQFDFVNTASLQASRNSAAVR